MPVLDPGRNPHNVTGLDLVASLAVPLVLLASRLPDADGASITRSLQQNLPGVEGPDAQRYVTAAGVAARAQVNGRPAHHLWYSGKHHAFGGSVQVLPDGNRIVRKSTGRVYRDSQGRTRREDVDRTWAVLQELAG